LVLSETKPNIKNSFILCYWRRIFKIHAMDDYRKQVESAVRYLQKIIPQPPEVVLVLGSGLGGIAAHLEGTVSLPYAAIPGFPKATVESHAGNLIFGRLRGRPAAILQGRLHFYEGYSARELTTPLRVLSLLGAKSVILTNSAGGLNPGFEPGTLMVLKDHLNLIPDNPLRGPNIEAWGPRFPDLSQPYDGKLMGQTLTCARQLGIEKITTGVYAAVPGPSLETPAETRFLRTIGADAVGMSTVPEVIVARHAGLRVLAISVIANVNDPDNFRPILFEEVVRQTEHAVPGLEKLLAEVVGAVRAPGL
jgi:purine-nucleoside phosphorylase